MSDVAGQLIGATAYDPAGDKIGKIHQLYLDRRNGQPKWALIHCGPLGMSEAFVPLIGARDRDGSVWVAVAKDIVKSAPAIDGGDQITAADEAALLGHYGMSAEGATGMQAAEPHATTPGKRLLDAAAAAAGIGGTAANTTTAHSAEPEPSAEATTDP